MVPAFLGKLHPKRKTPWVANVVFMVATGLLAALVPIESLAKLVSVGTLLAFAIVCGGVLVLRRREPERERPFRVPGSPVVPLLGIASCLLLMVSLPWQTWVRLAAWFVLGLVVYFAYSNRRSASVRAG
jgi:APA family basic amino acid/polyamine antiporter